MARGTPQRFGTSFYQIRRRLAEIHPKIETGDRNPHLRDDVGAHLGRASGAGGSAGLGSRAGSWGYLGGWGGGADYRDLEGFGGAGRDLGEEEMCRCCKRRALEHL